ncbi:Lipopolysaccharide biosynthesis protein [gamma proteobacterium HdN1]|nr:Lipopolysaccharide biosynthesis protein [gamma proteobacterium HdN1]
METSVVNQSTRPVPPQAPMSDGYDDEISLLDLFNTLWPAKYWILGAGVLAAALAVLISLQMPNVYRSEAVLSPIADSKGGGLAGLAGQFGGLANLAGISLGGGSGVDKATVAIETLKSRAFLATFIERHQLRVPVIAAEGWDQEKKEWLIDPEIYDIQQQQWVREVKPPKQQVPSDLEVIEQFRKVLTVSQDKKSMIVTLSVDSYSPEYSQKWAQALIKDVNEYLRSKDVDEAKRSIEYLTREIETTPLTQIQAVLYQMIEEQKKTVMLASVRDGYVFQVIDPPVVPELKAKPKRALIVVVSVFAAMFLALFTVLARSAFKNAVEKNNKGE